MAMSDRDKRKAKMAQDAFRLKSKAKAAKAYRKALAREQRAAAKRRRKS